MIQSSLSIAGNKFSGITISLQAMASLALGAECWLFQGGENPKQSQPQSLAQKVHWLEIAFVRPVSAALGNKEEIK